MALFVRSAALTIAGFAIALGVIGTAALAEPPSAPSSSAQATALGESAVPASVQLAQQELDIAQARFKAGLTTNEEVEKARTGLAVARAKTQLQGATDRFHQSEAAFKAGIVSSEAVAAKHREMTASQVALCKAQAEGASQIVPLKQARYRAGIIDDSEVLAAQKMHAKAQQELSRAQAAYRSETIAIAKSHLERIKTQYRAGVSTRADLDQAQAEYDAALRQP